MRRSYMPGTGGKHWVLELMMISILIAINPLLLILWVFIRIVYEKMEAASAREDVRKQMRILGYDKRPNSKTGWEKRK